MSSKWVSHSFSSFPLSSPFFHQFEEEQPLNSTHSQQSVANCVKNLPVSENSTFNFNKAKVEWIKDKYQETLPKKFEQLLLDNGFDVTKEIDFEIPQLIPFERDNLNEVSVLHIKNWGESFLTIIGEKKNQYHNGYVPTKAYLKVTIKNFLSLIINQNQLLKGLGQHYIQLMHMHAYADILLDNYNNHQPSFILSPVISIDNNRGHTQWHISIKLPWKKNSPPMFPFHDTFYPLNKKNKNCMDRTDLFFRNLIFNYSSQDGFCRNQLNLVKAFDKRDVRLSSNIQSFSKTKYCYEDLTLKTFHNPETQALQVIINGKNSPDQIFINFSDFLESIEKMNR